MRNFRDHKPGRVCVRLKSWDLQTLHESMHYACPIRDPFVRSIIVGMQSPLACRKGCDPTRPSDMNLR